MKVDYRRRAPKSRRNGTFQAGVSRLAANWRRWLSRYGLGSPISQPESRRKYYPCLAIYRDATPLLDFLPHRLLGGKFVAERWPISVEYATEGHHVPPFGGHWCTAPRPFSIFSKPLSSAEFAPFPIHVLLGSLISLPTIHSPKACFLRWLVDGRHLRNPPLTNTAVARLSGLHSKRAHRPAGYRPAILDKHLSV